MFALVDCIVKSLMHFTGTLKTWTCGRSMSMDAPGDFSVRAFCELTRCAWLALCKVLLTMKPQQNTAISWPSGVVQCMPQPQAPGWCCTKSTKKLFSRNLSHCDKTLFIVCMWSTMIDCFGFKTCSLGRSNESRKSGVAVDVWIRHPEALLRGEMLNDNTQHNTSSLLAHFRRHNTDFSLKCHTTPANAINTFFIRPGSDGNNNPRRRETRWGERGR